MTERINNTQTQIGNTNSSLSILPKINPLNPIPINLRLVEGIEKLRRLITKEFASETSEEKCSNLPHLLSIVKCISNTSSGNNIAPPQAQLLPPSAVLKPFCYQHGNSKRFIVDIVSADGTEWCKVSARNPRSLNLLANGGGGFGQRSILDHAVDYIECAKQNPAFFKPPKVKFIFTSGISSSLAAELVKLGVNVEGEIIQDSELKIHPRINPFEDFDKTALLPEEEGNSEKIEDKLLLSPLSSILNNPILKDVSRLNLDITALLAYVSNLTNGHTNVKFTKPIITQQLDFEKKRPQKPILDKIFHGRELFCCQTAFREFQSILSTVGGPQEKHRSTEFIKRLTVLPDHMSERSKSLEIIGNIKLRSLIIFGSGDFYEAVTVTANTGFVRSAKTQGVDFPVFLHESRALTEQKEEDVLLRI